MKQLSRSHWLPVPCAALLVLTCFTVTAGAGPKAESYWQVDEVRPGMKGHGRTVMKGTKVETFDAEVLGVLKNTSPGRDLVICRLSGLNLEKTGVIAGMSGSPIYLDDGDKTRLLGAVAYAWPFGKEPIAGVTPFCQMHGFVEAFERRDLAEQGKSARVSLDLPLTIDGQRFDTITVSQSFDDLEPRAADGLWMMPLRTPLAATGFTPNSLKLMSERLGKFGLVPMQGGGATAKVAEEEKDTPLEPGGPLAVAMITGDFDLSGIGTVTHIEGNRVYGWGHPFMSLGGCEFPLMTGYIHTIYPRQTVSFKMGSPLKTVGLINADVSTCIAGWTGRKPDMLPMRMSVALGDKKNPAKNFNVQIARQKTLLANLVFTALTNSVDMEGDLPDELTADLMVRIELEGQAPIIIKDTYSGVGGSRAPSALYSQVGAVVNLLLNNSYKPVRITGISSETQIHAGRRTAEIEAVELDSETYAPGDTVKATVFLRPYKGTRQRVAVELKLPEDLPEGSYTATICDDLQNARMTVRDNPTLLSPQKLSQLLEAIHVQTDVKRTNLVLRVPTGPTGVALEGQTLTQLPGSMVQILGSGRRTGAQTVNSSLVSRQATEWVIQGSEVVRFNVTRHGKVLKADE